VAGKQGDLTGDDTQPGTAATWAGFRGFRCGHALVKGRYGKVRAMAQIELNRLPGLVIQNQQAVGAGRRQIDSLACHGEQIAGVVRYVALEEGEGF
jgi:hypothetical protein